MDGPGGPRRGAGPPLWPDQRSSSACRLASTEARGARSIAASRQAVGEPGPTGAGWCVASGGTGPQTSSEGAVGWDLLAFGFPGRPGRASGAGWALGAEHPAHGVLGGPWRGGTPPFLAAAVAGRVLRASLRAAVPGMRTLGGGEGEEAGPGVDRWMGLEAAGGRGKPLLGEPRVRGPGPGNPEFRKGLGRCDCPGYTEEEESRD